MTHSQSGSSSSSDLDSPWLLPLESSEAIRVIQATRDPVSSSSVSTKDQERKSAEAELDIKMRISGTNSFILYTRSPGSATPDSKSNIAVVAYIYHWIWKLESVSI